MSEKKVWLCKKATDEQLEDVLNELAADGYHVFKIELGTATVTRRVRAGEEATTSAVEPIYLIVAFNQVELAKKLATDQVLQAIQQVGAEALRNATAKENKEQ